MSGTFMLEINEFAADVEGVVDRVSEGDICLITSDGKVIARIVPIDHLDSSPPS